MRVLPLVVDPDQRVLHPVLVVALGIVLARMRAAALRAVRRPSDRAPAPGRSGSRSSSVSIRSVFQISERSVTRDVGVAGADLVASCRTPSASVSAVRNTAAVVLHGPLHVRRAARRSACRRWRGAAGRGGRAPPRRRSAAAACAAAPGLISLGGAVARRRGRTPPGRAASWSPAGWRRAPTRRPPRRSPSGPARPRSGSPSVGRHDLAVIVGRDAAHVVVHGRQHRDRLSRHVDAGEDARGLGDAGQALVDAPSGRDARGAGRCGPCSGRSRGLRGSRSSSSG